MTVRFRDDNVGGEPRASVALASGAVAEEDLYELISTSHCLFHCCVLGGSVSLSTLGGSAEGRSIRYLISPQRHDPVYDFWDIAIIYCFLCFLEASASSFKG